MQCILAETPMIFMEFFRHIQIETNFLSMNFHMNLSVEKKITKMGLEIVI